jgi:hypothetical protein
VSQVSQVKPQGRVPLESLTVSYCMTYVQRYDAGSNSAETMKVVKPLQGGLRVRTSPSYSHTVIQSIPVVLGLAIGFHEFHLFCKPEALLAELRKLKSGNRPPEIRDPAGEGFSGTQFPQFNVLNSRHTSYSHTLGREIMEPYHGVTPMPPLPPNQDWKHRNRLRSAFNP